MSNDNEVATSKSNLPAEASAFFDESMGNADSDSFAIPFLTILQLNSPQCDPDDGAHIEEARKGLIFNTVTSQMYEGIEVFPVLFKREFLEWVLRSQGGGLVDKHLPEDAPKYDITEVEEKMVWLMENGHQLVDTRQHYVLFRSIAEGDDAPWNPAMMGMSSSQIKRSKQLMTMLQEQRRSGVLKSFKLGTRGESNEKGNWSGWTIQPLNDVTQNPELLNEAVEFLKAIKAGEVAVEGEESVNATPEKEADGSQATSNTFD